MSLMPEAQRPVLSDAELLQRLARRDSTALIEVERRHWSSLYAQVYGMVIDSTLAERVPLRRSMWAWLRDMARELARAEQALAGSSSSDDESSIRGLHEASTSVHPGAAAAGNSHGADAVDSELPRV